MRRAWPTFLLASWVGCNNAAGTTEPAVGPSGQGSAPKGEPTASTECAGPPPGPGYECVQDCGPPVASTNDPIPGWRWLSAADANNRRQFGCPICLPDDTRISTPLGEVRISKLEPGTFVWGMANGQRVARRVLRVLSVEAPADHQLAVIELEDGRRLRASPGHPDAGGRALGRLAGGDSLDGSRVERVTRARYSGRTFDLVLEAGSAHYFADGVLVRSTLVQNR